MIRKLTRRWKELDEYWFQHYHNPITGLCALCGNSGKIDTRGRAISAAGVHSGVVVHCICPNGRALSDAGIGNIE